MKEKIKRLLRWATEDRNYYDEVQMACEEITIDGIDQDLYGKLLIQATDAGAVFMGTKATLHGCEFNWEYDATSQTLNVTCTKKPFYIGCGVIEHTIRELADKAKGAL